MKTLRSLLVWIAGAALLFAMAVDTLAMLGRQLHVPLLGAIELVQSAVVIAASGGLLVATLERSHARVHLLFNRVPQAWREVLERAHAVAATLLYVALLAGSAWMVMDLWSGSEESELLRIPYLPLRLILCVTLCFLLLHALRHAFARRKR